MAGTSSSSPLAISTPPNLFPTASGRSGSAPFAAPSINAAAWRAASSLRYRHPGEDLRAVEAGLWPAQPAQRVQRFVGIAGHGLERSRGESNVCDRGAWTLDTEAGEPSQRRAFEPLGLGLPDRDADR